MSDSSYVSTPPAWCHFSHPTRAGLGSCILVRTRRWSAESGAGRIAQLQGSESEPAGRLLVLRQVWAELGTASQRACVDSRIDGALGAEPAGPCGRLVSTLLWSVWGTGLATRREAGSGAGRLVRGVGSGAGCSISGGKPAAESGIETSSRSSAQGKIRPLRSPRRALVRGACGSHPGGALARVVLRPKR